MSFESRWVIDTLKLFKIRCKTMDSSLKCCHLVTMPVSQLNELLRRYACEDLLQNGLECNCRHLYLNFVRCQRRLKSLPGLASSWFVPGIIRLKQCLGKSFYRITTRCHMVRQAIRDRMKLSGSRHSLCEDFHIDEGEFRMHCYSGEKPPPRSLS